MNKRLCAMMLGLLLALDAGAGSLYGSNSGRYRLQDDDKDGVINARDQCGDTPPGARVDHHGCHETNSKLLSIELEILFDSGRSEVKPRYYSEVKKLADFMRKNPGSSVVIEGHTDNVGDEAMNAKLSQNRATAIADVLISSFRISSDRVKAIGYGESRPIANNETAEGRATNRRVVAEIFASTTADVMKWNIYSVDRR